MSTIVVHETATTVIEVSTGGIKAIEVIRSPTAVLEGTQSANTVEVDKIGPQGPAGPPGVAGAAVLERIAAADLGGHRLVRSTDATHCGYVDVGTVGHGDDTLGITVGAASTGAPTYIQNTGSISFGGWAWTPLEPVFAGNDGLLTQNPPEAGFVQEIGHAESATSIYIAIKSSIYY